MLNIGVIGTGRIGSIRINDIFSSTKANLVAIASASKNSHYADKFEAKLYKDALDLIKDTNVDAVFISNASTAHYKLIKACIKEKKAIFCEKPVSLELSKIIEIKELINKNNIIFQVGFNRRFDPNVLKIKNLYDEGKLGKLLTFKIISRDPMPPPIEFIKDSGGIFLDFSIHDFDSIMYITGLKIDEVFVRGANLVSNYGDADIDTAIINLILSDGSFGYIENCRATTYGYDQRLEIFGSKSNISYENVCDDYVNFQNETGKIFTNPLSYFGTRYKSSIQKELDLFIDSVLNKKNVAVNIDDALNASIVSICANRSFKEKRAVRIEEIRGNL